MSSRSMASSTLRPVRDLLGGLGRLARASAFDGCRARGMDVLDLHALDEYALEQETRDLRRVLEAAREGKVALANTDVVSVGDGLEVVELDLFQLDRGPDPDVGLREEVRVSVDPQAPPFEHRGGEMKLGRVDALRRADVADVLGAELKRAEVQGLEGAVIHVGDVAIANAQAVDLEIEGQRLQRLLPSLLLQRHIALCLGADLSEIHVDGRAIERDVGHDPPVHEGPPVHAHRQPSDGGHGRVGIGVLEDRRVPQVERDGPRVHVKDVPAQRLVGESSGGVGQNDEEGEQSGQPEPAAASSVCHGRRLLAISRVRHLSLATLFQGSGRFRR